MRCGFTPPNCHLADLTHATLFNLIHRDQFLLLELGRARIHITGGSVLKMDRKKTMDGREKVRAEIVPHYCVYSSINFEVPTSPRHIFVYTDQFTVGPYLPS